MLSIIILSYLRKKCVESCVDSLLKNSKHKHEIIVISQKQSLDLPVIVKNVDENLGVSKGRNYGVGFANGEYILFLDDDCTVDPNWDEKLPEILEQYRPDTMTCKLKVNEGMRNCELLDYTFGPDKYSFETETVTRSTYIKGVSFHRKETFLKNGGFDERFFLRYEDADYSLRILDSKETFCTLFTPDICINHFHDHGDREYEKFRWDKSLKAESFGHFKQKWHSKLQTGLGNLLLDPKTPEYVVQERLNQVVAGRVRYQYFPDINMLENKIKEVRNGSH